MLQQRLQVSNVTKRDDMDMFLQVTIWQILKSTLDERGIRG